MLLDLFSYVSVIHWIFLTGEVVEHGAPTGQQDCKIAEREYFWIHLGHTCDVSWFIYDGSTFKREVQTWLLQVDVRGSNHLLNGVQSVEISV